jgi:hypothetical protein
VVSLVFLVVLAFGVSSRSSSSGCLFLLCVDLCTCLWVCWWCVVRGSTGRGHYSIIILLVVYVVLGVVFYKFY